jgi:hypothetical protein
MRTTATLALVACVVWAPARADDRGTALAVVERAIKAHGGADALTRSANSSRSAKGTITLEGKDLAITSDAVLSLPEKAHMDLVVEKSTKITSVINGEKGWELTGGAAREMVKEKVDDLREEAYVWWLATLAPLQKETFELSSLPESQVNGKPADVVKVASKGHPDARLYFDKATGLLVKIDRTTKEAGLEVFKEYLYSDHKEIDGVKVPLREVLQVNGRKRHDVTLTAYKVLAKPDESAFTKP